MLPTLLTISARDVAQDPARASTSTSPICLVEASEPPRSATRADLRAASDAVGAQLSLLLEDVTPTTRIVVTTCMSNSFEFVYAFLGAAGRAWTVAPLNSASTREEVEASMRDTLSSCVLVEVDGPGASAALSAADALGVPCFAVARDAEVRQLTGPPRARPAYHALRDPAPTRLENAVALYLHTSGTTSKPKLVPLTHRNLACSVQNIIQTFELCDEDASYLVMPLYHIHGLQAGLLAALAAGGRVIMPSAGKFSAASFWRDATAHGATWYTAVPTIHSILLTREQQDAAIIAKHALRFARSCSSPLAQPTLERLEAMLARCGRPVPVLESYAMTEAAHQMTSNPLAPKNGPRKPGSVGRGTNVAVAIVDVPSSRIVDGTGPAHAGEVCVRGFNVFGGYVGRPDADAESFLRLPGRGVWFRTGDVGYLDADGYLFLVGRTKELINRGGEKVSPVEIDEVLLGHPAVSEACAFGLPSDKYGEEVFAAVVLRAGAAATPDELRAHVAKRVSKDKVPTQIFVVGEIPKTATGKVQRRHVASAFAGKRQAKM